MLKYALSAAAALTIVAPASAEHIAFVRDGVNYVANITQKGDAQYIRGHGAGESFSLKVVNGHVNGWYAGRQVSYAVPAASAENELLSSR